MSRIVDILEQKVRDVVCIAPSATVRDAAEKMNEHRIGSLVVIEGDRVAGMFTERDVLRRVVGEGRDPMRTAVRDVMTRDVICCGSRMTVDEARGLLKHKRIRHLPVLDEDQRLVGMISIGDLNAWELNGQEVAIANLHEYIYGRV